MLEKKLTCFISKALKYIIVFLPIIWGLYIVDKYGVNVCYLDEWTYFQNREHFLSIDYLWAQHNEHRMLFPKIITFIIGSLFSWNSKAFMYTSQCFLLLLYLTVFILVLDERKLKEIKWADVIEIAAVGLCVYNCAQCENLLWGFKVAWIMIVSLGSISYIAFDKFLKTGRRKYFLYSMILAIISSYSSLHGLAVWGGYLLLVIVKIFFKEKLTWKILFGIIATCFSTVLLYFLGWSRVSGHQQYAGSNVKQILKYFFGQIGEVLVSTNQKVSYLIAILLFSVFAFFLILCVYKRKMIANIKYIGPMIMGLGSMFFIAMGRSNGNTGAYIASRYVTNSMIFLSFFMLLLLKVIKHTRSILQSEQKWRVLPRLHIMPHYNVKKTMQTVTCVLVILFIGLAGLTINRNVRMEKNVMTRYKKMSQAKTILTHYEQYEAKDYQIFYPIPENDVEKWRALFKTMKEEHLNAFNGE